MYGHTLRVYDEYLAKQQPVPAGSNASGNQGCKRNASGLGSAEIMLVASGDVTISAGKSISLNIEESIDGVEFLPLPISFRRIVGSQAATWSAGEEIGRLPLPSDCKAFVRINISSDDSAASGSVDAMFSYLPR